jgi:hypothetical protein
MRKVILRRYLVKTKAIAFFLVFIVATTVCAAAAKSVLIHNGFGTGKDYIDMSPLEKRSYAMGALNGMMIAPLFGAPKDRMQWLGDGGDGDGVGPR